MLLTTHTQISQISNGLCKGIAQSAPPIPPIPSVHPHTLQAVQCSHMLLGIKAAQDKVRGRPDLHGVHQAQRDLKVRGRARERYGAAPSFHHHSALYHAPAASLGSTALDCTCIMCAHHSSVITKEDLSGLNVRVCVCVHQTIYTRAELHRTRHSVEILRTHSLHSCRLIPYNTLYYLYCTRYSHIGTESLWHPGRGYLQRKLSQVNEVTLSLHCRRCSGMPQRTGSC